MLIDGYHAKGECFVVEKALHTDMYMQINIFEIDERGPLTDCQRERTKRKNPTTWPEKNILDQKRRPDVYSSPSLSLPFQPHCAHTQLTYLNRSTHSAFALILCESVITGRPRHKINIHM